MAIISIGHAETCVVTPQPRTAMQSKIPAKNTFQRAQRDVHPHNSIDRIFNRNPAVRGREKSKEGDEAGVPVSTHEGGLGAKPVARRILLLQYAQDVQRFRYVVTDTPNGQTKPTD